MRRGRVFFETMPCGAFFVQIFMQKCESRLGERGEGRDSGRGQRTLPTALSPFVRKNGTSRLHCAALIPINSSDH